MVQIKALQSSCRRMKSSGKDHDEMLAFLRRKGCSKVDSMRVIMIVLDVDLARAKRIVHESKAWADVRDRDDRLHGALEKAAKAGAARSK